MTTTVDAAIERCRELAVAIEARPERHGTLTGDRPTAELHMGHYLSSLRNRVALQDKGVESFVVIAGYQVIADRDSVGPIKANALVADRLSRSGSRSDSVDHVHSLRSLGAQPVDVAVPQLGCRTRRYSATRPSRMRSKRVGDRCRRFYSLTRFTRPRTSCSARLTWFRWAGTNCLASSRRVLSPGGPTRWAGVGQVLPEPAALINDQRLILGLDGQKMSKSWGNAIRLAATATRRPHSSGRHAPTPSL